MRIPSISLPLLLGATLLGAPVEKPPMTVLDLKLFYQRNCVKCHGLDGSARSAEGKRLGGRDFTDPRENRESDEAMARTIRKGIFFGKVMPSFKNEVNQEEALLMVREVVRKAAKGQPIAPQVDPDPHGREAREMREIPK